MEMTPYFTSPPLQVPPAEVLTSLMPDSPPIISSRTNHKFSFICIFRLEDAERKYLDIIDTEKQHHKKKEQATREIISDLSKKLKQQEKQRGEDAKVADELRKRHEMMKKRLEKVSKEKSETVTQLKSLFALFTQ